VAGHPKGEVGWPGLTLEQCMNRFQNIVTSCGITKADLGIVPYGLRHQFATDLFKDLTGLPAPVLKELAWSEYQRREDAVSAAFLDIARQLGPERKTISHAYIGSVGRLQKVDQRTRRPVRALADATPAFRKAGVQEAWISASHGGPVPIPAAAVLILVGIADPSRLTREIGSSLEVLDAELADTAGVRLSVGLWLAAQPPDQAIAIPLSDACG
jgi:hypothetical protein